MEFLSVFASVDKDQDLVIHEVDLDNYAAEMNYEKAFTQKWLRLFDRNKDGKITFTEFCETLGLDEKIYEAKLLEVRKTIVERRQLGQQQSQLPKPQQSVENERANRRINRLPPKQPATVPAQKSAAKENVEPQQTKEEQKDVEEEVVKPHAAQKNRAGPKSALEEVQIEIEDDDPRSIGVEYSDMDPKELEVVKELLAQEASHARVSANSSSAAGSPGDFDRRLKQSLDKKLDGDWQCQSNPKLSHSEVNYQEGSMAVLVTKQQRRVMLWRPQKAGGMCCCS